MMPNPVNAEPAKAQAILNEAASLSSFGSALLAARDQWLAQTQAAFDSLEAGLSTPADYEAAEALARTAALAAMDAANNVRTAEVDANMANFILWVDLP